MRAPPVNEVFDCSREELEKIKLQWAVFCRAIRAAMHITQAEMAHRLGLAGAPVVWAWEQGNWFPNGSARRTLLEYGTAFGFRHPPEIPKRRDLNGRRQRVVVEPTEMAAMTMPPTEDALLEELARLATKNAEEQKPPAPPPTEEPIESDGDIDPFKSS